MTTFKLAGRSSAEEVAMRGLLAQHGVSIGRDATTLEATTLTGPKVDASALEKATLGRAEPLELNLDVLRKLLLGGKRLDVDQKHAREVSRATLASTLELSRASAEELSTLATAGFPSKEALGKLEARTRKLKSQLDDLSRDETKLAWLEVGDFGKIAAAGSTVVAAHADFQRALATHLEAGAPPPGPVYAQLLEQLRDDALNVGGWSAVFLDDLTRAARDTQSTKAELGKVLGLDAAALEQHFVFEPSPAYPREISFRTKGTLDLDRSGQGLNYLVGLQAWTHHRGNLDLSDNLLATSWDLPGKLEGNLSLADNAYADLSCFRDRPIEVVGDVDLSRNKNLRRLDGLSELHVTGNLDLRGIPARSLPFEDLTIGGKIILDAAQTSLIDSAKRKDLAVEIVGTPLAPFVVPADPLALLRDVDKASRLTSDQLREVMLAVEPEARLTQLAEELLPLAAGDDEQARRALGLVGRYDHEVSARWLAAEVAQIPTDPATPMPAALTTLPMWKLESLAHRAQTADMDALRKGPRPPRADTFPPQSPLHYPRSERVIEVLLERGRAGEVVDVQRTPLTRAWANVGDSEHAVHRSQDAAFELILRGLQGVRLDKGELYTKLAWSSEEVPASVLFQGFKGYASSYVALERLAQRHPEHTAFQQLYDHLLDHKDNSGNVFVAGGTDALRTAFTHEHIALTRAPSAPLAAALEAVRGVTRTSTPAQAQAAAQTIRAQLPSLSNEQRGALLQDLYTQDRLYLTPRGDSQVRLPLADVARELLLSVDDDRQRLMSGPLMHLGVDVLRNDPTATAQATALLDATLDGLDGRRLGWMLTSFGGPLTKHEAGQPVVTRQLDRLLATATEPSSLIALEFLSGRSRHLDPLKAQVLERLGDASFDGDLAKVHADLVRRMG